MALLGGGVGGAGNPVGGSFTGPAEALEIVGDFAYAYSGSFPASTTAATRLSFTTGNYLFVGEIRQAGMINTTSPVDGRISVVTVKMNNSIILLSKTEGAEEDMPSSDVAPIIIPPYTKIEVIQDASDDESAVLGTISMTGRIYRTRD